MKLHIIYALIVWMLVGGCLETEKKQMSDDKEAERVRLQIETSRRGEPISKYIYGQFIEHLGYCIYNGIWSEMIWDRKFFYPVTDDYAPWTVKKFDDWVGKGEFPVMSRSPWKVVGRRGCVRMATDRSFVGAHTPEITVLKKEACGIEQMEIGLISGKEYVGRVILSGDKAVGPIEVSLIWGEGKRDKQVVKIKKLSGNYVEYALSFVARADTKKARLQIVGRGMGKFRVGTISLMPADNLKGWRKDVVELMRGLESPVYRWPGGNFVSGYNWKDGIGPRDKRGPKKNPAWTGIEHNDVGIHEFMDLCELLDTEPFVAVNTGLGDVGSVAEEVEYCNGSVDTAMGSWRANNGRREPFGVKWWAVGNEMYGEWQLGHIPLVEYTKKHNAVARAMKAVDPKVQLIGVGSVGRWSEAMLGECSENMALISEHFYCTEKADLKEHIRQMPYSVKRIADFHRHQRTAIDGLAEKDIRIALDEWNYWLPEYLYGEIGSRYYFRDALGIAAGLHEYFRNSDIIFMANYAQTVNVIGAIKTNSTDACYAATALPLKLYRQHFGEIPIKIERADGPLDISVAMNRQGDSLTIGIVNPSDRNYVVDVELLDRRAGGEAWKRVIAGGSERSYNEPGKAANVYIQEQKIREYDGRVEARAMSISVYEIKLI